MAKKFQIDWYGNFGWSTPAPGKFETLKCGICGTLMNVKRNVLGATSMAEAMALRKHRHDEFTCPNIAKSWHKRIDQLKMNVYLVEIGDLPDRKNIRRVAEKEILELLKANLR